MRHAKLPSSGRIDHGVQVRLRKSDHLKTRSGHQGLDHSHWLGLCFNRSREWGPEKERGERGGRTKIIMSDRNMRKSRGRAEVGAETEAETLPKMT